MKILYFAPKIYLYVIAWLFLSSFSFWSHMKVIWVSGKNYSPHTRPKSYPPHTKKLLPLPHRRDPVPKYADSTHPCHLLQGVYGPLRQWHREERDQAAAVRLKKKRGREKFFFILKHTIIFIPSTEQITCCPRRRLKYNGGKYYQSPPKISAPSTLSSCKPSLRVVGCVGKFRHL